MSENINNGFESLLAEANEALKCAGEALNLAVEGMPSASGYQLNYIVSVTTSTT